MQQPNLGRKIAKLRKAKGLTQEELVEKCNLSVRTLQRIEAGEVMPRSYTIKLIFFALGQDAYEEAADLPERLKATIGVTRDGSAKFFMYIIDLFNLKTNTMKKLSILSIILLSICTVVLSACLTTKKVVSNKNSIIGTWQILNSRGLLDSSYANQPGITRYKMISNDKFVILDVKYRESLMSAAMAGNYAIYDDVYTETIHTAGMGYSGFLGVRNTFKYKVTDSLMYINGLNNSYKEVWKRVK
ncbi:MAG: family transcriptional regulator [Bacteroidota bacterium]|nr:family transcriptional regulator [Bacteroidota bacterium]